LSIKLKQPLVYALVLFVSASSGGVIMVPKETDSTLDLRGEMLGTGPWFLQNYTPSVGFTLKRNDAYWDKDWALVDQIEQPIISEYAAALAQLKAGNIYMFGQSGAPVINPEDVLPLKRDEPRLSVYQSEFGAAGLPLNQRLNFGWLPAGESPFLDERVRQAVALSFDRDLYLDTFLNVSGFASQGVPLESRWHAHLPGTFEGWWLDPKGKDYGPNAKYFQHDLTEGKRLLAAAGYPNGLDVASRYVTGPELGPTPKHAEVIDGFARELGIRTTVEPIDYIKEYAPLYREGRGQFDGWAYAGGGGGAVDATQHMANEYWSKSGTTFKGFSTTGQNDQAGDPQIDSLIEKARLEQDVDRRKSIIADVQRYLGKAWYMAPLPGVATGLTAAWPCQGNYRVYQGARNNYRYWIDETKPPFKTA
jgi:peptide/nickel transport system substrate-binding protein